MKEKLDKLETLLTVNNLRQVDQEELKELVGDDVFSLLCLCDDEEISDDDRERIEGLIAEKILTAHDSHSKSILEQELEQVSLYNTDLADMNGEKFRQYVEDTEEAYLTILDYCIEHRNGSGKEIPLLKKDFSLDEGKAIFDFLSDMGVSNGEVNRLNDHLSTAIQRGESDISLIVSAQCDYPDKGIIYAYFPSDDLAYPLALFPVSGRKLLKILHIYTKADSLYSLFGVKKDDIDQMKNGDDR